MIGAGKFRKTGSLTRNTKPAPSSPKCREAHRAPPSQSAVRLLTQGGNVAPWLACYRVVIIVRFPREQ